MDDVKRKTEDVYRFTFHVSRDKRIMENLITQKQVTLVRTLASRVCPDDENYRSVLSGFGVLHTKELSKEDATKLINALLKCVKEKRGFRTYKGKGVRGRQQHLTQLQADRITILNKLLKWEENPNRLTGFIHRQTGKLSAVDMLANYEATRVIVGLEKVLSNNNNETFLSINKMTNAELEKCV